LELPNSGLNGGGLDGMGDLDAPAPPMDTAPMDDPNMMDDPNAMGEDPMGDPNAMDDQNAAPESQEDEELIDLINSLSIEDKAAAKKYIESMADDNSEGEDEEQPQDEMPMESRKSLKRMIDETIEEVLKKDVVNKSGRDEDELPSKYNGDEFKSPFKTQYQ